jgi:hypothetical protein
VELKWILAARLNHSFENLKALITWSTGVKHGGVVTDINGEERTLHVVPPEIPDGVTSYFLDHPRRGQKIQVFVLKEYLREKYKLEFRSRTAEEVA